MEEKINNYGLCQLIYDRKYEFCSIFNNLFYIKDCAYDPIVQDCYMHKGEPIKIVYDAIGDAVFKANELLGIRWTICNFPSVDDRKSMIGKCKLTIEEHKKWLDTISYLIESLTKKLYIAPEFDILDFIDYICWPIKKERLYFESNGWPDGRRYNEHAMNNESIKSINKIIRHYRNNKNYYDELKLKC